MTRTRFSAHARSQMLARGIPERAVRRAVRYGKSWAEQRPDRDPGHHVFFVTADVSRSKPKLREWSGLVVVAKQGESGGWQVITSYLHRERFDNWLDLSHSGGRPASLEAS